MSSGPPLKKLKQSMLSFMKPGVKLSKGLPNKQQKYRTSDSNIRHTSLVGAEEMDQEIVRRIMSSCELDPTLEPPAEELPATTPVVAPANLSLKVDVLLKAVGDAPILKQKKWSIERAKNLAYIVSFLQKHFKFQPQENLFLYVNQSFAPPLDVTVGQLHECFANDGKLVLSYCKTQAWG